MKTKLLIALFIVLWIAIGFGVPYIIHFKLNFLGANFVTIKDIIGLWVGTPLISFLILVIFLLSILDKQK